VDTPHSDRDFIEPELMSLIRRADLVFLVVDLQADPLTSLRLSFTYWQNITSCR
jgi:hypothetical protein